MGETRVDLQHLLEDIRDAYPGSLEELTLPAGRAEGMSGSGKALLDVSGTAEGGAPPGFSAPASGGVTSDGTASDGRTRESPSVPEPPALPQESPGDGQADVSWPSPRGRRKAARPGLSIQFERRRDDPSLGRLAETTVWVNEAHPAYLRAAASRSEGYHLALTVALSLAPLAAEPGEVLAFVTTFLSRWGELTDRPQLRRRSVS